MDIFFSVYVYLPTVLFICLFVANGNNVFPLVVRNAARNVIDNFNVMGSIMLF